jgi:hypothetical protein
MPGLHNLAPLARRAAASDADWRAFFEGLREAAPAIDRICAAVQLDPYTAYLAHVAQPADLDPILGRDGLYADRENSCAFQVIAAGAPYLVSDPDWALHADLAIYGVVMRSNLKVPVQFAGRPAVWNVWSRAPNVFDTTQVRALCALAEHLNQSPYAHRPIPVGLSLRRIKALGESRAQALAASNP